MREEIIREVENEFEQLRAENERKEQERKEEIRREQPEIFALVREREQLIFGTLRDILQGKAETEGLETQMETLSGQIRTRLTEKGYPPDYLAPVFRCPLCQDQGRTGQPVKTPCVCFQKAYQKKLRQRIGLSGDGGESFETFNLRVFSDEPIPGKAFSQQKLMAMVCESCREWAERYPDVACRDLVLSGKSGLGKTFLLRAMAERLVERDVNVLLISAYRLLETLRRDYFSHEEPMGDLFTAAVLMIDDLGSEPLMQNVTVEQLFNLLNERQNRGLSTVISTNLTMEEFRNRYTERIASRLRDRQNCKVFTIYGKDVRTGGTRE